MRNLITTLFVAGMFLTTAALADDVEDVKAAVRAYFASLNAGDADANIQSRMPGDTVFAPGQLLNVSGSLEEQKRNFQANVDAGQRLNLQLRHLEARVYGNLTAIVTAYIVGTNTPAGGTAQQVRMQRTGVWIKQGGQWKEVHSHRSPLNIAAQ
ncbi:nuclear transport factor 2 family protein [Acidobacteria bacterium AH-259-D05]|nr:nuclear transport factor 2 family protein [Acidobacteria bacterium AH-259-D05]